MNHVVVAERTGCDLFALLEVYRRPRRITDLILTTPLATLFAVTSVRSINRRTIEGRLPRSVIKAADVVPTVNAVQHSLRVPVLGTPVGYETSTSDGSEQDKQKHRICTSANNSVFLVLQHPGTTHKRDV